VGRPVRVRVSACPRPDGSLPAYKYWGNYKANLFLAVR
jgi:hypothetical protein